MPETIRRRWNCGYSKASTMTIALLPNRILSRRAANAVERRKLYQDAGWKSFDASAPAYTQSEIDAERRRYNSESLRARIRSHQGLTAGSPAPRQGLFLSRN